MDAPWWNGEPGPEHDPNAGGSGIPYRCASKLCTWTGRGGANAYAHHRETGHPIDTVAGHRQIFGCCAEHAHLAASGD